MQGTIFTHDGAIARGKTRRSIHGRAYCCVTLGDLTIHVSGEQGAMAAYKLSERLRDAADEVLATAALDEVSA